MKVSRKADDRKFDAQLKEWNTKINLLKASADKAKAAANITYYETIEAFHAAAWKFK